MPYSAFIPSVVSAAIWTWPQNFLLLIRMDEMAPPTIYGHIIIRTDDKVSYNNHIATCTRSPLRFHSVGLVTHKSTTDSAVALTHQK